MYKETTGQSMSNPVKKRFDETRHYIDKKDKALSDRIDLIESFLHKMPDDLFMLITKG